MGTDEVKQETERVCKKQKGPWGTQDAAVLRVPLAWTTHGDLSLPTSPPGHGEIWSSAHPKLVSRREKGILRFGGNMDLALSFHNK